MFEGYKLVSHKNCADGSACAILFQFLGGKDVVFVSPGEHADEVALDLFHNFPGKIIFADISVSLDVAEILDGRKYDILLFDHHKSAIPLKQYPWCEIEENNTRCGSMMFFDWIRKELWNRDALSLLDSYKRFIELVDDYDLWSKTYGQETEDLAALFLCLGQKLFVERFLNDASPDLLSKERYLLDVDRKKKEHLLLQKKKEALVFIKHIQGKDRRVAFVTAKSHNNEIAEAIYNDADLDVDLVVLVSDRVSFRAPARSDIDCSVLAASFGAGGHRLSAGSSLKNIIGVDLLDLVASKI